MEQRTVIHEERHTGANRGQAEYVKAEAKAIEHKAEKLQDTADRMEREDAVARREAFATANRRAAEADAAKRAAAEAQQGQARLASKLAEKDRAADARAADAARARADAAAAANRAAANKQDAQAAKEALQREHRMAGAQAQDAARARAEADKLAGWAAKNRNAAEAAKSALRDEQQQAAAQSRLAARAQADADRFAAEAAGKDEGIDAARAALKREAEMAEEQARVARSALHETERMRGKGRQPVAGGHAERWMKQYDERTDTAHAKPIGHPGAHEIRLAYGRDTVPHVQANTRAELDTPTAEAHLRQAIAEATLDGAEAAAITPRETLEYARAGQRRQPPRTRNDVAPPAGPQRSHVNDVPYRGAPADTTLRSTPVDTTLRKVPDDTADYTVQRASFEQSVPERFTSDAPTGDVSTPVALDTQPRYVPQDGVLRKVKVAKHGNFTHVQSDHLPKVEADTGEYSTAVRNFMADAADVVHARGLRDSLRPEAEAYDVDAMTDRQRRKLAGELQAATPTMRADEEDIVAALEV